MVKRKPNAARYKYPLPIHPIELPPLIPHNPISWIYWAYCYFTGINGLTDKVHVEFFNDKYVHIIVKDESQMIYLWEHGFFGTGQLSRSEPTWKTRTNNRLAADSGTHGKELEKVTQHRRLLRLEFKKQREKLEQELLELRRNGGTIEQEKELIEYQRKSLREYKLQQSSKEIIPQEETIRDIDLLLFTDDGKIRQLESLELLPVEAMFLTFALPVLDISAKELTRRLIGYPESYMDIHDFISQYVVYHHYRSHGWCVRSGVKFGCDYLLYQRGPPLEHAEFCIRILGSNDVKDYNWYSSLARVIAGANKTYVLCYVENLSSPENILRWWHKGNYRSIFSSYKVGEITYKRWIPGKNRE